jgi:hypothetical protein
MLLIDLLKTRYPIYGLDAPIFAWVAAVGLLVFAFYQLTRLSRLVRRECHIHQDTMRRLEAIQIEHAISLREGLSSPAYEAIAKAFGETHPCCQSGKGSMHKS